MLELTRVCHTGSKLPLSYYTDAHRYAVYTLNRLIRDGKQKSPFEIITGRVVDTSQLHQFGSVCYVYLDKNKREAKNLETLGLHADSLIMGIMNQYQNNDKDLSS